MYNNYKDETLPYAGIPYNDINWYDVAGQPFGTASNFNAIIFGDANNIVDTKGAMAVGGNFVSPRGLSLAYGNDGKLKGTGYSPNLVRFLVGGNVAMQGPLVVIGHVVAGGNFRAANGSTYMIGKDGSTTQAKELSDLYQANGASRYWRLSDRGSHYAVSSYDVPRFIPASRVNADLTEFFNDARESLTRYQVCLIDLQPNGTVTEHYHEWILRGNDPAQNVFLIDARPNGLLNKEIRFEIPEGSLAIVKIRTGDNAHLQYGLWGDERHANHTLYVFEDAKNIYMEVPAAIWGSILAPRAMFHAHKTGGNVNGNAALGSFAVSAESGFEFHMHSFVGGVQCGALAPTPPVPLPAPVPQPTPQPIPAPRPMPIPQPLPAPRPMPVPQPIPAPRPIPVPQPMPLPRPMPTPQPMPAPRPIPVPQPAPCPTCPEVKICPVVEECPKAQPCPPCIECPPQFAPLPCPPCPMPETRIEYQPIPIPIPVTLPCPEQECCCEECLITPGVIFGCIWGCSCCCNHDWEIKLYKSCGERKVLLHCATICCCGCFQFDVPYDDFYLLSITPIGHKKGSDGCRPMLSLKNVGVANLMME